LLIHSIFTSGGTIGQKLVTLGIFLAAILLAIIIHEMCHGFAAYALGDPTAKEMGRLSLNPLRHIDPIGALMMLIAGFGWAKPVQVDARNFHNPKRDMALTALAGPVSNFIFAFLAVGCFHFAKTQLFFNFLLYCTILNIGLGMFNLIPIPPLDGSKVLGAFLPNRLYFRYLRMGQYGMFLLMALVLLGNFSDGRFSVFGFLGDFRDALFTMMIRAWGLT
jgi:Zn-dependent protease